MSQTPLQSEAYQKVPGQGRGAGVAIVINRGLQRLWLGTDHLLLVTTRSYKEEYHRFYFRDIRAILHARSRRPWIYQFLLLLISIPFFVWAANEPGVAPVVLGFTALAHLMAWGVNMALGPACRTVILTQVSQEQLGSLRRQRTAAKALALIEPAIRQAQAGVVLPPPGGAAPATVPQDGPPALPAEPLAAKGWHRAAFASLLLMALADGAQFALQSPYLYGLGNVLTISSWLLLVVCTVMQQRRPRAYQRRLKLVTWWALAAMMLDYFLSIFYSLAQLIRHPGMDTNPYTRWLALAASAPQGDALRCALLGIEISLGLALGALGLATALASPSPVERP